MFWVGLRDILFVVAFACIVCLLQGLFSSRLEAHSYVHLVVYFHFRFTLTRAHTHTRTRMFSIPLLALSFQFNLFFNIFSIFSTSVSLIKNTIQELQQEED